MFCLGCGTELAARASVCPACGRPVSAESAATSGRFAHVRLEPQTAPYPVLHVSAMATAAPAAEPVSASISRGDLALFAIPRDVTSRLVVALPVLLALDLLAPWIVFGEAHIAPARLGPATLLAVAPLALISLLTLYTPLKQRPIFAALPLVLGSLALGASGSLLLAVGPLAPRLMQTLVAGLYIRLGIAPTPVSQGDASALPLSLGADIGLYAFVVCAAVLVYATYRRLDDAITEYFTPFPARTAVRRPTLAAPPSGALPDMEPVQPPLVARNAAAQSTPAAEMKPGAQAPLPGSIAWTQAPELPTAMRNGPTFRGLRRMNPRG